MHVDVHASTLGSLLLLVAPLAAAVRRGHSHTPFDQDPFVFDPKGRLLQLDYADAAASKGAPCVGLCANNVAVLAAVGDSGGRELEELEPEELELEKLDWFWWLWAGSAKTLQKIVFGFLFWCPRQKKPIMQLSGSD